MADSRRTGLPFQTLILSFRIVLGIMFLYAGIEKAIDVSGFARAIDNYRILPGVMVGVSAITLPWIEIMAGASLLAGFLLPGGAFLTAGLLLMFSGALASSLLRGLDISCGCFSSEAGAHVITWWYLLRDVLLFAMACAVLFFPAGTRFTLDRLIFRERVNP